MTAPSDDRDGPRQEVTVGSGLGEDSGPAVTRSVVLCFEDFTPGPRDECPDRLHDHPLPFGYGEADEVAQRRLRQGWRNRWCRQCGLYGWVLPADMADDENDDPCPYCASPSCRHPEVCGAELDQPEEGK